MIYVLGFLGATIGVLLSKGQLSMAFCWIFFALGLMIGSLCFGGREMTNELRNYRKTNQDTLDYDTFQEEGDLEL